MSKKNGRRVLILAFAILGLSAGPLLAGQGEITLKWDASPGAAGYRVYYGTAPGKYGPTPIPTSTTSVKVSGLQDCTTYYMAVKAWNSAGESPFSLEVSGWPRPRIATVSPSSVMQGEQLVLDVYGANFESGAGADLLLSSIEYALSHKLDPPQPDSRLVATSVSTLKCDHIQVLARFEPSAAHAPAAPVGPIWVAVNNPDRVYGESGTAFQIQVDPSRLDLNKSDDFTKDRIDGSDVVWFASRFNTTGSSNPPDPRFDVDYDIDGSGAIDGEDLAYYVHYYGLCRSASGWSLAACPATLR